MTLAKFEKFSVEFAGAIQQARQYANGQEYLTTQKQRVQKKIIGRIKLLKEALDILEVDKGLHQHYYEAAKKKFQKSPRYKVYVIFLNFVLEYSQGSRYPLCPRIRIDRKFAVIFDIAQIGSATRDDIINASGELK
jgi:hypothetical protein